MKSHFINKTSSIVQNKVKQSGKDLFGDQIRWNIESEFYSYLCSSLLTNGEWRRIAIILSSFVFGMLKWA